MKRDLRDLIAHAKMLRELAYPTTNALVTILDGLDEQNIKSFTDKGKLEAKELLSIAERLKLNPAVVATTFHRQIVNDLLDYSTFYKSQVWAYRETNIPDTRIASFVNKYTARGEFLFLLHDSLQVWFPEDQSLDYLLIEDHNHNNGLFENILRGYLIVKRVVYSTTLHLLEESYSSQWINWAALWKYY